jgi:ubiquinone biosynthesis protein UbiJ
MQSHASHTSEAFSDPNNGAPLEETVRALRRELYETRQDLAAKLTNTRQELAGTRRELASTREELAGTRGELAELTSRLLAVEAFVKVSVDRFSLL